jgi:glycosyltransferase involved in cell wall biosynthesis
MSGVFLKHLLSTLDSVEFTVLAPHDRGLPESENVDGIEIRRFRYAPNDKEVLAYRGEMHRHLTSRPFAVWRFIRSYRNAAMNLIRNSTFDLIWAHWWVPGGWIGRKAKDVADIPFVVTCHGTDIFLLNKYRWLRGKAAPVFNAANRVTVVSTFLKEQLAVAMKGRVEGIEEKTVVAPMPVDARIFYYDEGIEPEPGSIICASRLTRQKNIDRLILAASRLEEDNVQFRVDIYGDGPERQHLEKVINDSSLSDRVQIHKPLHQAELADRYRKSQIAVLVSEREGFGLALLEAMLCGCAGIGARSGGIADIVTDDGKDGILVEPGDVFSLYRSLKDLLTDQAKLGELREACRESAVSRFSNESISRKFGEILEQL